MAVIVYKPRYYRVEWKADLTGIPPTTKQYGSRVFRPTYVEITYTLTDGHWVPDNAVITGPQVKKDGADGETVFSDSYYLGGRRIDDAPDWLKGIALSYVPKVVSQ